MRIDIITIFPDMFKPVLEESILKRAQEKKKITIKVHDLRDFTLDKHHKVDDRPFGGGSGMLMQAEPIFRAVESIIRDTKKPVTRNPLPVIRIRKPLVVLMSPRGKTLNQKLAKKLSKEKHLILICGRYEGVDERVSQYLVDEELSIGDYVLTGGELPAMVLVDTITRLLPGVLGDKNSLNFESFEGNVLEYPQYSRPADFRGWPVPEVLLSGDHQKISQWRKEAALKLTKRKRPDLFPPEADSQKAKKERKREERGKF